MIPWIKSKTAWEKEISQVLKKEEQIRKKKSEKKESFLNQALEEKIPAGLSEKLTLAFEKAFSLVFQKGDALIEKTYAKSGAEYQYKLNVYGASLKESRKNLKAFSKKAGAAGGRNLALAGLEGVGLGLLGIGLPDIPLFTAMIFKSLYETGAHYGYSHGDETERYWNLLMIQGALSYGEEFEKVEEETERFLETGQLPDGWSQEAMIAKTARLLSGELLYMKFLQGVPLVGAVGGAYDVLYMNRIQTYGGVKFRKRFLLDWKRGRRADCTQ